MYDLGRIPTLHSSAESLLMRSLKIENYRAFGKEKQTARLAPLTLLVGENSTGKTSFMALIRALWDVAYSETAPSFQEYPFDLGSFNDIVHNHGSGEDVPRHFSASFAAPNGSNGHEPDSTPTFEVQFDERDGAPFPTHRRFANGKTWIAAPSEPARWSTNHQIRNQ